MNKFVEPESQSQRARKLANVAFCSGKRNIAKYRSRTEDGKKERIREEGKEMKPRADPAYCTVYTAQHWAA